MNWQIALVLLVSLPFRAVVAYAEEDKANPMPTVTGEAELQARLTKVGYQFQFGGPYRAVMRFRTEDGQLLVVEEYMGSGVYGKVEYPAELAPVEDDEGTWLLKTKLPVKELSNIKAFGKRDNFRVDGMSLRPFTTDGKTVLAKPNERKFNWQSPRVSK